MPPIAKVTPLVRLFSNVDRFDYYVPSHLKDVITPGQYVTIPWRSQSAQGVVLSLEKNPAKTDYRIRPIRSVIDPVPILTKAQLSLTRRCAAYYATTQGAIARIIAPALPKRFVAPKKTPVHSGATMRIEKARIPLLQDASATGASIVRIADISSFLFFVLRHISMHAGISCCILFPTLELLHMAEKVVRKQYDDAVVVFNGALSKSAHYRAYCTVRDAKRSIVLATRVGVFLPFPEKFSMIIFEESSQDYKQSDQFPRYDARLVAQWHAEERNGMLIRTRASLPLEETKKIITLPSASAIKTEVALVDMQREFQNKEFSILSERVLNAIRASIASKKKALIIALRNESENGISLLKIQDILTKNLKNCKISIQNQNSVRKSNFDILLSTPVALEGLKLAYARDLIEIAVIASIEPILGLSDYRSSQRAYERLCYWRMVAHELRIKKIFLQAFSPEHKAIRAFAYGEEQEFIAHERASRKKFSYPPFVSIIKLTYIGGDPNELHTAEKILSAMKHIALLGPQKNEQRHPVFLIKVMGPADLRYLSSLSKEWVIDRDPEHV